MPCFATFCRGGARIICSFLFLFLKFIDPGWGFAFASAAPRLHHQWFPDEVMLERGYSPDTIRILEDRGHKVIRAGSIFTSLQTVGLKDDGLYQGASDPRRPDAAAVAPAGIHAARD
jgi:gamma-glutamyltranspeptidase/glutathione hydrolase